MREIGSEFCYSEIKYVKTSNVLCCADCSNFVFSGRTAIETVLINEKKIKKKLVTLALKFNFVFAI